MFIHRSCSLKDFWERGYGPVGAIDRGDGRVRDPAVFLRPGVRYASEMPAGSVMRATVPWPGNELILMTPSYFRTR